VYFGTNSVSCALHRVKVPAESKLQKSMLAMLPAQQPAGNAAAADLLFI
jgi:hypothetical protein